MRLSRILIVTGMYAGCMIAGVFAALVGTILFALILDPHGDGAIGEGLIFLAVFALLAFVGVILGFLRAEHLLKQQQAGSRSS